MRNACALLGLLTVGCLTTPPRPGGAGDGGSDGGGKNVDAGPLEPWPADLAFREYAVARIDDDNKDDLLVINNGDDPATRGVYVLLGRDDDMFGLGWNTFIATDPVRPMRVDARDVQGADGTDVLVVGRTDPAGELFLLVHDGAQAPSYPDSWARFLGTDNANGTTNPYHVTGGDLDGDSLVDIVAGNIFQPFHVEMTEWSMAGLEAARLYPIPPRMGEGAWSDVITAGLHVIDPSRSDLVFARQNGHSQIYGGDNVLEPPPTDFDFTNSGESSVYVEIANLDADPRPEVVAGSGTQIRTWFVEPIASPDFDEPAGLPEIFEILVADLNRNGAPEIVTLGRDPTPAMHVVRDVVVDRIMGTTIWPLESSVLADCPTFTPTHLVYGDFDGDLLVEVLAIAPDGEFVCRRLVVADASAELEPCGMRCL